MSFVAAEQRRRENNARIAQQHRSFAIHAKETGISDSLNNFAKWQVEEQLRKAVATHGEQQGRSR